ncbi:hypothetical protein AB0D65_16115 [Streptomyces griseoloalbus]|uniref:LuxR family transcriptional regulator n=1 Tax=Streptomyces griseoloalbus TaxID=67303 RepID=A0ABV3E5P6_9ACTN
MDDAQWLDPASAQALAFVAHRLDRERIALVLAVREPDSVPELADLPHLSLTGLQHEAARTLLVSEFRAPLDDRVRERILAEAQGNPLALLELPRRVGPSRAAGGFGLPQAVPLSRRIEESFERRLRPLPPSTSAPLLSWPSRRPGTRHGCGRQPTAWASTVTPWPPPRPPAWPPWTALCASVTPWSVPWSTGWRPRPSGAGRTRCCRRSRRPGRTRTAGCGIGRAAALTPDAGTRAWRALGAAPAAYAAGDYDTAERLAADAQTGPEEVLRDAQADLVRRQVAFAQRREAREQSRAALEMFSSTGAEAFAALAAQEPRATGEHTRQLAQASA